MGYNLVKIGLKLSLKWTKIGLNVQLEWSKTGLKLGLGVANNLDTFSDTGDTIHINSNTCPLYYISWKVNKKPHICAIFLLFRIQKIPLL